jgi:hypothetical protein
VAVGHHMMTVLSAKVEKARAKASKTKAKAKTRWWKSQKRQR